jgi:hypothetical protein
MIVRLYSIYDKKSENYSPLFPAPTPGAAERAIADQAHNPETQLAKWPGDFALYDMCVFDDETGFVTQDGQPPRLVVEVSQLV